MSRRKADSAAMIVERAGRVLLLQRSSTATWGPDRWNMPTGMVEPGESAEQAAIRETWEEAGLIVSETRPIIRAGTPDGGLMDVFYAIRWSGSVRLNEESQDYAWIPIRGAHRLDLIQPQKYLLWRLVVA